MVAEQDPANSVSKCRLAVGAPRQCGSAGVIAGTADGAKRGQPAPWNFGARPIDAGIGFPRACRVCAAGATGGEDRAVASFAGGLKRFF